MLLPGAMVGGDGEHRTFRDWVVDAVIFLLALGVGTIVLTSTWQEHSGLFAAIDLLLGLAACSLLWFRRGHPLAVAAVVLPASAVSGLAGGAALVVVFNAALRCDRRALAWIALGAFLASASYSALFPAGSYLGDMLITLLLIGIAVGWGLFARSRRALVVSLRERAARLEAESQLHAEQAREAERRRIAREMHDVLAHRISLLSLHAGALEFRPDAPPEEIAAAAGVIRAAAHAALEELREVIGVLREGTEGATLPPQPSLRDLPELIAEARAAGMRVEAEIGLPRDGTAAVSELSGRTAYRIIQEGLTNARKHAPNARVRVRAGLTAEGLLEVELRNPQPVGAALGGGAEPALPGAGSGLIGLGERVGLAGGELSHGPDERGDYALRATLPAER
ncbi:MAG: sensor histidine kinase [Actinobacteria bacterium]|nr:sensor histidine kinase [Actinomycetota bacterium]